MENYLYPVSFPQVDWQHFVATVEDNLGTRPTKSLDNEHMKLEQAAAVPMVLAMDNPSRIKAIQDHPILQHIHCSFAGVLRDRVIMELHKLTGLDIYNLQSKEDENYYVVLVSGNLGTWHDGIEFVNKLSKDDHVKNVISDVRIHLNRM